MSQKIGAAVVTLILIVGIALVMGAAAPPNVTSWEYSTLTEGNKQCVWDEPEQQFSSVDAKTVTPDEPYRFANRFVVYKKLGGQKPREECKSTDVLNVVGRNGWELVAILQTDDMIQWTFKRSVR